MKRELDERIADWVDGRLSPRDQERLEAEFRVNSKLRQQAEEYRETVERVRRALAEPGQPVNLVDRVMEQVQLDRARPGLGNALPFLASFAAAAAMILLFLALYRIEPAADQSAALETAKAEADPDGAQFFEAREEADAPSSFTNRIVPNRRVSLNNTAPRSKRSRARSPLSSPSAPSSAHNSRPVIRR